jgi:hypothetical protein
MYLITTAERITIVTPNSMQKILTEHEDSTIRRINELLEQKTHSRLSIMSPDPGFPSGSKSMEPEDDELW